MNTDEGSGVSTITGFSLSNPSLFADPYPVYAAFRRQEPIHASPMYGGSRVFFSYSDVEALLTDDRLTNSRADIPLKALPADQRAQFADMVPALSEWVAFFDGDAHMMRRRHMNHVLRVFTEELLTPLIERSVEHLLRDWGKEADLIADVSRPLPAMAITELLGAPMGDHPQLAAWSDHIAYLFGASDLTAEDVRRGRDAVSAFIDYLHGTVSTAVRSGTPSLLAQLVTEETDGLHFDLDSACAQGLLLMFAGLEPVRHLIGNAFSALHPHPAQSRSLRAGLSVLPHAVEEFLRFDTPVQFIGRTAARAFTYRGHRIAAGQVVLLHVGSANRDPDAFSNPERLDLERVPHRHLSFGRGPHAYIGALLVRLQTTTTALRQLLTRFPDLRVSDDRSPVWNNNLGFHGFSSLPVRTHP
ncbi:cytochrome P450 [Streptomyces atroolivaceus]|uniref:cytochrome P450 n=1 Tax=Streptomyces atroolivaceus TaxID=66869 RepID=UPI00378A6477